MELKEIVFRLRKLADEIEGQLAVEIVSEVKLEDVRVVLAGKKGARELVNSFGVQRLSDVPVEKLPELLEKAKKL